MLNNGDAPYNFANSDPRQAMHSKDAQAKKALVQDAAQETRTRTKQPGTAMVPIGPVVDAGGGTTQFVIREHKFATVVLAGLIGFAIGAALGR